MTDVRRSVKALRPDALEKYDLEKAVAMTVEEMRHAAKVEIDYRCSTSLKGFNNDEEEVIYRIVQRALPIPYGMGTRLISGLRSAGSTISSW